MLENIHLVQKKNEKIEEEKKHMYHIKIKEQIKNVNKKQFLTICLK